MILLIHYCCACSRQINIDYVICEALKCFPRHRAALIIYDICCQWFTNFWKRVSESEWLEIWDDLDITAAVGKWHLVAHIRGCFAKFSLNFIEGSTQIDGEIMETLWSGLNLIAGITQGMTITEGLAIEKAQYGLYSHTSKDCLTHSCSSGCLLYTISNPWGDAYLRYRRPIF